jgi:hypothetical protein
MRGGPQRRDIPPDDGLDVPLFRAFAVVHADTVCSANECHCDKNKIEL